MAYGESIAGLLNLAAFAAVLSLGYIGLDKVDPNRVPLKKAADDAADFAKGSIDNRKRFRELMLRVGLSSEHTGYIPVGLFPVAVIAMIAGSPLDMPWYLRLIFPFVWNWYLPYMNYFSRRIDVIVIGVMAIISTGLFLTMSAATAWPLSIINNAQSARVLFWILAFVIVATILHSAALYRILSADVTVNRLIRRIERGMTEAQHRAGKKMAKTRAEMEKRRDEFKKQIEDTQNQLNGM